MNSKPNVLIAESECIVGTDLTELLSRWGLPAVDVAMSFEQTMDLFGEKQYDLIIYDTVVNGCNGGIHSMIRMADKYNTSVILLADFMSEELEKYKILYESVYSVSKPFDSDELRLLVETALSDMKRKKVKRFCTSKIWEDPPLRNEEKKELKVVAV